MEPSAATATAVISRFDDWYKTNPAPAGVILKTSPLGSVPAIRLPVTSTVRERTWVSSVRKKTEPVPGPLFDGATRWISPLSPVATNKSPLGANASAQMYLALGS